MKTLSVVFAITLFLFSAFAARTFAAQDMGSEKLSPSRTMGKQMMGAERASFLMNKTVNDAQGQRLGKIDDIVVSETGGMNYAIISGPDNKLYPVPLRSIHQGSVRGQLFTNITRDQLRNAPSFTRNNWPDLSGPQWEQRIFSYYGETPGGMGMMGTRPGMEQGMRPEMEHDMHRGTQPGMMAPGMDQGAQPGTGATQPQGRTAR